MAVSKKYILLFLASAMLLLPAMAPFLPVTVEEASKFGVFITQACCVGFLYLTFKQTHSRSLRVFWQYLCFAILCALLSNLLTFEQADLTQLLTRNFFSLFLYFFIFLAIETNPHLSNIPLNKYIAGRVPAIFFTLLSFSYFVLIPLEFEQTLLDAKKSPLIFHILLNALIAIKLFWCVVKSPSHHWRLLFASLIAASLLLIYKYLASLNALMQSASGLSPNMEYVLLVLPLLLLMTAACFSPAADREAIKLESETHQEGYILLLMLVITALHVTGKEMDWFYVVDSNLQAAILLIGLLAGSAMLVGLSYKKYRLSQQLKQELSDKDELEGSLIKQKAALEQSLVNSEDKAIVGVSNNAILTTSIEGKILSANPAAVQMFQYLEQDLVGANVSMLFSNDDEMHFFFNFQSNVFSLQRKETGISVECSSVRSDGTEFPAQAELQWAEREQKPLIVLTFINLSARKLAEKQALELKDKFIANISHEFRTPLTIINGIIDRYIAKTSDSAETDELTTAKRNGLRLVRMVEQLLELSRVSDNPKLNLVNYRLQTLMTMPVDSFSRLAAQSQLNFTSDIPDDLWLECDAQAFEKIIFNLIANAVKYTPAGGSIQVNGYEEQDTIVLDVIDSGIGISKENQNKIFERFQRADDPNNQAIFGVGIGLSLVNELVKAHGWRILLASEEGHGSKFSLSIPMAKPLQIEHDMPIGLSENEVTSLLTEQRSVSSAQASHSHQVVLVIEDNADMQSHIKQVVEQKHHCILAGSGELGLQLAQEYVPDLIVCDLMLTGIDGFEVLKNLKENELTAHIPVILLTARSDLESRLQGLNLNADEYLSKPFNQNELLTRIQNLIENRKNLQQRYLEQFNKEQKGERLNACQSNAAKLTPESSEPSLDEQFLSKLETLIATHYTEPTLDIAMLASELAMSERQLQRKMKVMLDTTPNNFIKEFRLKKAQELLKGGAQIGRIALDVGFSSQTYFGRCFKESFNCTPKQYQQQCAQSTEEP